jgi:hypothetical protein
MTDFRAMCAELVDELEHTEDWPTRDALLARARALLAQPVAEGPSEDELIEYWYEDCEGEGEEGILRFARYIRRTNHPQENK